MVCAVPPAALKRSAISSRKYRPSSTQEGLYFGWRKNQFRYLASKLLRESFDHFVIFNGRFWVRDIVLRLLRNQAEELDCHVLVGIGKFDSLVRAAGSYKGGVQMLDVVCGHEKNPTFVR
jgi:hypothetical protein